MTDPTPEFFDELGRRGHEPLLERVTSTLRFDIVDGKRTDHWLLRVDNGDVKVSHKKGAADAVLRADKETFAGIARGEVNAFAAVLRGTLDIEEGDPRLLVLFQRILPSPPAARKRPRSTRQRRKT